MLATVPTPDGGTVELVRQGSTFAIYSDGRMLMSSATHGSEEVMAHEAARHLEGVSRPRVLVGGLGLGYTLRAALDALAADAEVVCVELLEALAEWHRGPLGPLAGRPLEDPRVRLVCSDVVDVIRSARSSGGRYDAILLDVDNGPTAMTAPGNRWLYAGKGLAALHAVLGPSGTLVVWSAGDDPSFVRRMKSAGFETEVRKAGARSGRRTRSGHAHVLFVGRTRPAR